MSLRGCLQVAHHSIALDVVAFSYHAFFISFRSAWITSLHRLRGPPRGRGSGSQLNRLILDVRSSGILARWPSHSSQRLEIFSVTVSLSPTAAWHSEMLHAGPTAAGLRCLRWCRFCGGRSQISWDLSWELTFMILSTQARETNVFQRTGQMQC